MFTAMLPVDVATVGLMFRLAANVAAAVLAIVPQISSIRERPTGFGESFVAQPGGIEHKVFVPATPVIAAIVVKVFFVTGAPRLYSSSAWVPVVKLTGYSDQMKS